VIIGGFFIERAAIKTVGASLLANAVDQLASMLMT